MRKPAPAPIPAAPVAPAAPAAPEVPRRPVLIAEDNEDTRNSLKELLELACPVTVDAAKDGVEALEHLTKKSYSLLLTDLRMPRMNGLKLIEQIQAQRIPVTVIVTTGHGNIPDAVQAMRLGAYDFLTKPPDPDQLCALIERALRERALQDEVAALRSQLQGQHAFKNVLSKSPRMLDLFDLVSQVAEATTTVLIGGETGTGKEQLALAIHQASSARRSGPFIAVHCAALPEQLMESELFGHEKGAFTGATNQRKGRFEHANGGTLFLDEVGDIPLSMQVKLLRVLQERCFERVGGSEAVEIDVRIIAATNRPLERLVQEGKFREDLYYRLNVIRMDLPPLRERPEDIPLLATHFAQKYARPGQSPCQLAPEAMEILIASTWPGNIRQMENAMERACVTARDGTIRPENLPEDVGRPGRLKSTLPVDLTRPLPEQLAELTAAFEERYLRRALRKSRGHVGRCARISGLSRRSVTDKIGHYKIDKTQFKRQADEA